MAEQGQVAPNPQDLDEAIEVPKRNQTPAQPPVTFREFDVKYSTILSKKFNFDKTLLLHIFEFLSPDWKIFLNISL